MHPSRVELWGGVECTINRVGDVWFDQMARCGHYGRLDDSRLFRQLGLKKLRYGLLWERAAKAGRLEVFDPAVAEMRRLDIEPIAGLLHHGSGPPDTDLMDPEFPSKLAHYAFELA